MTCITKDKKALVEETIIKILILIVLFAIIGAALVFLLKKFGVI